MTAMDTYNNLATWTLLVRRRDNGDIDYSNTFGDRTDAQDRANDFDAGKYAVSIYAANTFAQAIVSAEEIQRANMTDDELLAELGL
tara:strand:+ start:304 stop:561 length:258 start_codon:yes stop_codon:yes gene_type:complete